MSVEHSIYRLHWQRASFTEHLARTDKGTYSVDIVPGDGRALLILPDGTTVSHKWFSEAKLYAEAHAHDEQLPRELGALPQLAVTPPLYVQPSVT